MHRCGIADLQRTHYVPYDDERWVVRVVCVFGHLRWRHPNAFVHKSCAGGLRSYMQWSGHTDMQHSDLRLNRDVRSDGMDWNLHDARVQSRSLLLRVCCFHPEGHELVHRHRLTAGRKLWNRYTVRTDRYLLGADLQYRHLHTRWPTSHCNSDHRSRAEHLRQQRRRWSVQRNPDGRSLWQRCGSFSIFHAALRRFHADDGSCGCIPHSSVNRRQNQTYGKGGLEWVVPPAHPLRHEAGASASVG